MEVENNIVGDLLFRYNEYIFPLKIEIEIGIKYL